MKPMCKSERGDRDDQNHAVLGNCAQFNALMDDRIFEQHVGSRPDNHCSSHVSEPPEFVNQICCEISHEHENRHAEKKSKDQQSEVTCACRSDSKNVVQTHDQVGEQDGENSFAHTVRDFDSTS